MHIMNVQLGNITLTGSYGRGTADLHVTNRTGLSKHFTKKKKIKYSFAETNGNVPE